MLLQFCALGVTMSWDEGFPGARASRPHDDGFPGARASRPHQAWHGLDHLPHLDQPGTAPWLSFGLADAVPADRVAACSIAPKLSGGQRDRMRAGRPRSQGNHSPLEGESQKPSRQAKADAVGGWRAISQKADVHPLGNYRLPASRTPARGVSQPTFPRPPTRVIPHSPAQRSDSPVRRSPGQWTIMLKCARPAGGSTRPSIRSSDP